MTALVLPPVTHTMCTAPQSRLKRAFDTLRAEIEATPPRAPNVTWAHVVRVVDGALAASAAFRPRLEALEDVIDLRAIDALPLRVEALGYTEFRCLPPGRGDARKSLRRAALELRGRMQLDVTALRRAGARVPDPLRPLTRAGAYHELAGDLLKLAAQLNVLHAAGRTGALTAQELAEVEPMALALLRAGETRSEDEAVLEHAQLLRRRAYALVFDGYAELRSVMEFVLRRRPGAVDELVPRLARVAGRNPRKPQRRAAPPVAPPTPPRAPRF
jgi:hypothetical protein